MTGMNTHKCQILGSLSLQVLRPVEACVAPGLCDVVVVMGGTCRTASQLQLPMEKRNS